MAFHDFVGICGVISILLAYILLQIEKIPGAGLCFSIMNFAGAIMILYSLYFDRNLSSIVIEIAWVLISTFGILRALRQR